MKEFNLSTLSSNVAITEAQREEGIILKIDKEAFEQAKYNGGYFVVRVKLVDENYVEKEPEDDRAVIPGHPNCRVGDCINCHVVSCAIYQGYEDMP